MFEKQNIQETISKLNSDTVKGLTEGEAFRRLRQNGRNEMRAARKKTKIQLFLEQLKDPLIYILLIAAVVSILLGEVSDALIIGTVVLVNALVGMLQEGKARKALEALRKLTTPRTIVIRDGIRREIPAAELVTGDLVELEAGARVPADIRLTRSANLQVEESALTGESVPVEKDALFLADCRQEIPLTERVNMVYMSTVVTNGHGEGLVVDTGMDTEIGRIASMITDTEDEMTPLQKRLGDLGKLLSILSLGLCAGLFLLAVFQHRNIPEMLLVAISLAVAAVPEGLPAVVTICLALSVTRMVKVHTIIRRLPSVETLGAVSVVCSDKTGTLTQNKMTVTDIYINHTVVKPESLKLTEPLHRIFLYNAILNNDASVQMKKEIGDPTESCLLTMAQKAGLTKAGVSEEVIREMIPRMEELAFDSERKLMSTKYRLHGITMILTKGAVDVLLERCVKCAEIGGNRDMTDKMKEKILQQNQKFSENGLRVLAFAYKEVNEGKKLTLEEENGFIFVGLAAMIDPPREEAVDAVQTARQAGIRTVMITGDHKVTAEAIAKKLGIFQKDDLAVTGQELDAMSDEELDGLLEEISVYARVSPENKIRIVRNWQKKGRIVAMTGDGVNDAPALKKADIGVAMGITGTEVSKDASSMILADDNFATIIKAVLNGRNVYRNIKNAIQFLLSGNMAAIIAVLVCSVAALPSPFKPVHLLFINLLTDSLPALAIGMEPSDPELLKQKPRNPEEGILTGKFVSHLFGYGALIAAATMAAFCIGLNRSDAMGATMAFATLTLARLFHGFTCRSERSLVDLKFSTNLWSIGAFAAGTLLLAAVLFLPGLQILFEVTPLSGIEYATILGLAITPTIFIQGYKFITSKKRKNLLK